MTMFEKIALWELKTKVIRSKGYKRIPTNETVLIILKPENSTSSKKNPVSYVLNLFIRSNGSKAEQSELF